ncbi:MAG: serine/threonine protein kinase, partial [Planctomycetes bacterium]|nr:serine/threonine protein kinase [Planctomycetota bacterium]
MPGLDDYDLVRVLARGGMGVVHEAVERATGRRVALKRILGAVDPDAQARFLAEGRALARLSHPGIVAVHTLGQARGGPYLVMDLVEGESLQRRLERDGPLPAGAAAALCRALTAALAHAHARGVLHRDLKPANVLLDPGGAPRLIDFGLARLQTDGGSLAHLTRTGELLGTPAFMAPEQADGRPVDARTDVYGLGATLFALLTGRAPFEGASPIAVLGAVLSQAPPAPSRLRPGLPPALDALVLACLAKDPAGRPASMEALGE